MNKLVDFFLIKGVRTEVNGNSITPLSNFWKNRVEISSRKVIKRPRIVEYFSGYKVKLCVMNIFEKNSSSDEDLEVKMQQVVHR